MVPLSRSNSDFDENFYFSCLKALSNIVVFSGPKMTKLDVSQVLPVRVASRPKFITESKSGVRLVVSCRVPELQPS